MRKKRKSDLEKLFDEDTIYNTLLIDKNNKVPKTVTAKRIGVNRKCIEKKYKQYKWSLAEKTSVNENYFETIDSPDKAYFLGLLYADGCVHKNSMIIHLQENDSHILNNFKNFLNYTGKIRNYKSKGIGRESHKTMSHLCISNKKLSKDLITLGCVPNKSLILKFPTEEQVPKRLLNHFIRGYFDGDGCIYYCESKDAYTISIVSTLEFLTSLKEFIFDNFSIKSSKICKKNRKNTKNTYSLSINSYNHCIKFLDFIYKDSQIETRLSRKYSKFYYSYSNNKDKEKKFLARIKSQIVL